MADFLQEVEEDLKRERAEKLWAKYSIYVYAAAAGRARRVSKLFKAAQPREASVVNLSLGDILQCFTR